MRTYTRIYVRRFDVYVYIYVPAYAARVLEAMKDKFFYIKVKVWNESHIIWEPFQTQIFNYIKPYMVYFKNTQKILRENLRFPKNNESKMEFFTKHFQVNFLLIETFSGLNLRVLKFTNQFCLVVNRFD